MATIALCDMCGCKAKKELASISLEGSVPALKGGIIPPPPDGFKYAEESTKNSSGKVTYEKVWDNVGRVIKETKYIQQPKRFKSVRINYDLCEQCFERFICLLESVKKKYHLEATEMKLIEDNNHWHNPFLGLIGNSDEDDD